MYKTISKVEQYFNVSTFLANPYTPLTSIIKGKYIIFNVSGSTVTLKISLDKALIEVVYFLNVIKLKNKKMQ